MHAEDGLGGHVFRGQDIFKPLLLTDRCKGEKGCVKRKMAAQFHEISVGIGKETGGSSGAQISAAALLNCVKVLATAPLGD
jgi:hypothetical protein